MLSGFWFLATVNSGINEFSAPEKGLITLYVAAVLTLQALILFATTRLPPLWNARLGAVFAAALALMSLQYAVSWGDELLMAAVGTAAVTTMACLFAAGKRRFILRRESLVSFFAAVNLYCLNLAFVSEFQQLPPAAAAMLLVAAWWFFARVFFDSLNDAPVRKFTAAAAALLFLWQAAGFSARVFVVEPPPQTPAQSVRMADFAEKPNVYFIALESVPPPSVLQMDLRLHASYDDRLRELGFRRFKNAFSEVPSTQLAINFVAGMDSGYVRSLESAAQKKLFTGNTPAPLYEIFRANGYRINAYNRDFFMGPARGRFVDDYQTYNPLTLCGHSQSTGTDFAGFFGYCILTAPQVMSFFGAEFAAAPDESKVVDFYLRDFKSKITSGEPQFFFARVQSAYHTSPFYRGGAGEFAAFRNLYLRYVSQTEELMARMAGFVGENDADALMFVFSDHGMYMAADGWDEHNQTAASRKYFIRDRYGIYAAARAKGCGKYFDEMPSSDFATPTMITRQIVKCLAGGKDPAAGKITYLLRRYDEQNTNEIEYGGKPTSYTGYLYERN